ncbi:MAG: FAD-dependent monooxygenase [Paracoccus sp. (in: a-proteobacteria)]|uniref:FAD-dependent oxidoreductase n=1 Tax=Paracoccus sp. TaxID=267 RepID=UPI0026DFC458|nr:FAD-dependent oxidoreductase [Paracoccus sp. (in: a-proteobacteria)]MDO5621327.1 FAD-dependent monooxygenase [Paracoccus sp. (in: a-proteobacteria)]
MNHLKDRQITIIGAGVAGLTAATALAQRGAQVTVLEQAGALREVGAGLQISPNAGRALRALGLGDALDAVSARSRAVVLRNRHGAQVALLDLAQHRPNDAFRLIHRARLVEVLEQAARDAGADIHLNTRIEVLPHDTDLLIGADGTRSHLRQVLDGRRKPFFTRQTAWRAVIPAEPDAAPEAQVFMGPRRHLVSYPMGLGLRNIVAVIERDFWAEDDWSISDDPDNLRRAYAGFGGPVPGWLAQVDEVRIWGLFRHEVAERWQDGRSVIIGDAAHPTLPFLAQGACMAIEDAYTLAVALDRNPDQAAALTEWAQHRRSRTRRIVDFANRNARNYHLSGPVALVGHAGLRIISAAAPAKLLSRFDWIYDYDPISSTMR